MKPHTSEKKKQAVSNVQAPISYPVDAVTTRLREDFRDSSAAYTDTASASSANSDQSLGALIPPLESTDNFRLSLDLNYPSLQNSVNRQPPAQSASQVNSFVHKRPSTSRESKKKKIGSRSQNSNQQQVVGYYYSSAPKSAPSLDASGHYAQKYHHTGGTVLNIGEDIDSLLAKIASEHEEFKEDTPEKDIGTQIRAIPALPMQRQNPKREHQQSQQQRTHKVRKAEKVKNINKIEDPMSAKSIKHVETVLPTLVPDREVENLLFKYFEGSMEPLSGTGEVTLNKNKAINDIHHSLEEFAQIFAEELKVWRRECNIVNETSGKEPSNFMPLANSGAFNASLVENGLYREDSTDTTH